MRFGKAFTVFVLFAVSLAGFGSSALAQVQKPPADGVSALSADWNDFVNDKTVYNTLDNLGVVDFYLNGNADSRFTVAWDGETPTIFLGGVALENAEVVFWENEMQVLSSLPGQDGQWLVTAFSLNGRGNFIIRTSDIDGYGGLQFVIRPSDGALIARAACKCVRSTLTTTPAVCTVAQCNDPGTTCNAAGPVAYCKWMGAR